MKMETSNKNGKENYIINGQSIGRDYQQFWREGGITHVANYRCLSKV